MKEYNLLFDALSKYNRKDTYEDALDIMEACNHLMKRHRSSVMLYVYDSDGMCLSYFIAGTNIDHQQILIDFYKNKFGVTIP